MMLYEEPSAVDGVRMTSAEAAGRRPKSMMMPKSSVTKERITTM